MRSKNKILLSGSSLIIGTAIGAGIFGIPNVVAKTGLLRGTFLIIIIGAVMCITLLVYSEIILRTEGNHQLAGYANLYLGRRAKKLSVFILFTGIFGALTAYLIGSSQLLVNLFGAYFPYDKRFLGLIFWFGLSLISASGLKNLIRGEKIMLGGLVALLILTIILGIDYWQPHNFLGGEPNFIWQGYGVVFFAFIATSALPEVRQYLSRVHSLTNLRKTVLISMLFISLFYLFFSLIIVGISGPITSEDAIRGVSEILGAPMAAVGVIFGLFTMGSSFCTLSYALANMLRYDLHFSSVNSWLITLLPPLGLFISDLFTFFKVLAVIGALVAGFEGIIILKMHLKAKIYGKRQPEFKLFLPKPLNVFLQFFFVLAILVEIIIFFL